jgi:FkbM family methyltransferase
VISKHLHEWSFWGSPDEWMVLLAAGPCTAERPYMLDIGSNLGVFTLIGAERGCHAVAFEPLSENIHRLSHSVKTNGYESQVMLLQHAVGKYFTDVTIGFRPSNPGASGINLGGSKEEVVQQITIDGLLLGKNPPAFKDAKAKGLPPLTGQYINFVKVDTEGYDVAVVQGMMRTFVEGRVPLVRCLRAGLPARSHATPRPTPPPPRAQMLIEFGPGDAAGTAGCDPAAFAEVMYGNGYSLWEWGYRVPLEVLTKVNIPIAINGTGRRVFEAWFIRDDVRGEGAARGPARPAALAEPYAAPPPPPLPLSVR